MTEHDGRAMERSGGTSIGSDERGGRRARFGPGALVAAAFIGPGTVTTATLAGAGYGYTLLWALTFSLLATLVLQEMAARLGLVTGEGLGEAVRRRFSRPAARLLAVSLVIAAIAFGNAAYETGNLLGAALGAEAVWGGSARTWAIVAGVVAYLLLRTGSYAVVERVLVTLVGVMAVAFLATAVVVRPPLGELVRGMLVPSVPDSAGILYVAGLVGTTVVPYNLFLHASAVRERWEGPEDLRAARLDLGLSIGVGALVSMAIVATSAAMAARDAGITSAADMAVQLEPLLGSWARWFFAGGLLAAGLTSAVTAPLAAAYATAGALGWPRDLKDPRLRWVWMLVLAAGIVFAGLGVRPVPAILFAQVANGVLLPAIAVFLLLAANDRRWMGDRVNGPLANAAGALVVLVALGLGLRALWSAMG
ncbi:MAG: Nramp family divalent metal transporter [Longimicrobiales bacterium]|nr:Nramp family divalent metal transporter [Longimicrobiales bacterium]